MKITEPTTTVSNQTIIDIITSPSSTIITTTRLRTLTDKKGNKKCKYGYQGSRCDGKLYVFKNEYILMLFQS